MFIESSMIIMNWDEYEFWKTYRKDLMKKLENQPIIEKTPISIAKLAKEIGIKPTARYFHIAPNTVRYYVKKEMFD